LAGHARLTGDTSGDDDDITALKSSIEGIILVLILIVDGIRAGELLEAHAVASDFARHVNVAKIGGDTRGADHVEDRNGSDVGVEGEEEGQGLTNATTAANDADLLGL
jgi:hypothetical protein